MNSKKIITLMVLLSVILVPAVSAQLNVPMGAENITSIRNETINPALYDPAAVEAFAGNLTELAITGVAQTKSWQGFFGNVSGTIILEDSAGFRFYDWSAAEPQGQVYASVNQSISWTTVDCWDITNAASRASWYNFYGMLDTDYDNINITYNLTLHDEFYVGLTTINTDTCRSTYTFVNDARQTADFPAVLLADENDALIFTALLEDRAIGARQGKVGYDGGNYDFQLLVAERGRYGDTATTTYYFWIEIY
jgi:hypothetical protein